MTTTWRPKRDFIGYGDAPPDPQWPGGARLAVNFVMNYEEGSEPSMQDGEDHTEVGYTEAHGLNQLSSGRDLAGEGMFEYGSRVGFWRLMRLFQERQLPMTVFGCALALECNPLAAQAMRESGFGVCSHGWRWIKHFELDAATERKHIARAIASLKLVVPYSLTNNDGKFNGSTRTADEWFAFVRDAFDMLHQEGARTPKMMSVGVHMRLIGHIRPRAMGLQRLLDYLMARKDVWITRRIDIASHWQTIHPFPGKGLKE